MTGTLWSLSGRVPNIPQMLMRLTLLFSSNLYCAHLIKADYGRWSRRIREPVALAYGIAYAFGAWMILRRGTVTTSPLSRYYFLACGPVAFWTLAIAVRPTTKIWMTSLCLALWYVLIYRSLIPPPANFYESALVLASVVTLQIWPLVDPRGPGLEQEHLYGIPVSPEKSPRETPTAEQCHELLQGEAEACDVPRSRPNSEVYESITEMTSFSWCASDDLAGPEDLHLSVVYQQLWAQLLEAQSPTTSVTVNGSSCKEAFVRGPHAHAAVHQLFAVAGCCIVLSVRHALQDDDDASGSASGSRPSDGPRPDLITILTTPGVLKSSSGSASWSSSSSLSSSGSSQVPSPSLALSTDLPAACSLAVPGQTLELSIDVTLPNSEGAVSSSPTVTLLDLKAYARPLVFLVGPGMGTGRRLPVDPASCSWTGPRCAFEVALPETLGDVTLEGCVLYLGLELERPRPSQTTGEIQPLAPSRGLTGPGPRVLGLAALPVVPAAVAAELRAVRAASLVGLRRDLATFLSLRGSLTAGAPTELPGGALRAQCAAQCEKLAAVLVGYCKARARVRPVPTAVAWLEAMAASAQLRLPVAAASDAALQSESESLDPSAAGGADVPLPPLVSSSLRLGSNLAPADARLAEEFWGEYVQGRSRSMLIIVLLLLAVQVQVVVKSLFEPKSDGSWLASIPIVGDEIKIAYYVVMSIFLLRLLAARGVALPLPPALLRPLNALSLGHAVLLYRSFGPLTMLGSARNLLVAICSDGSVLPQMVLVPALCALAYIFFAGFPVAPLASLALNGGAMAAAAAGCFACPDFVPWPLRLSMFSGLMAAAVGAWVAERRTLVRAERAFLVRRGFLPAADPAVTAGAAAKKGQ